MTRFKPGDIVKDIYGEWIVISHNSILVVSPRKQFYHPYCGNGSEYPFGSMNNFKLVKTKNAKTFQPDWL